MNEFPKLQFTDENIRRIFGTYDGEGENLSRLTQYYLKTEIYQTINANLPVHILVGNKGVGKSALFRVANEEAKEAKRASIMLKPDDVAEIGEKHESLILSIRKWKFGLTDIIAKKVLAELGLHDDGITANIIKYGGRVIPLIVDSVNKLKSNSEVGDSDECDHSIPAQADHPFRAKLTRAFRGKLTTPNA